MSKSGIILAVFIALAPLAVTASESPRDAQHSAFRQMAHQIILGLDRTRRTELVGGRVDKALAYLRRAYDYVRSDQMRIAVVPFEQDDIKIAKAVADEYNASLFAALIEKAGSRYDLMARQHLTALIEDMQQTGVWEAADGNPINALLSNAGKVDVLIRGHIRLSGQTAVLRYTALGMDGRLLAQTAPLSLDLHPDDAKIARDTVSLDTAVAAAAEQLADQVPDMEELLLGGVRFEDTGAQPAFGRYLEGRLANAVRDAFTNTITGRSVTVRRLQARHGLTRSAGKATAKDLSDRNIGGGTNSYVLSGSYWELPDSIELRFNLKGPKGSPAGWVGWIAARDAMGWRLRPTGDFGRLRDNDGLGPFSFQLTSDRGKNAAYRIGETMQLLVRLDREAWLYCFYRDAKENMIQILPNSEYWKYFNQPRFAGDVLHKIPAERGFGFQFTFTPPEGHELVKCFAVSRDVTKELPRELQGRSLSPLPRELATQITQIFQGLRDTAVSEASFVVTVSER